MKRPSFQFYPADWRKDPALSTCSLAARGLWIELMCVAHEAEQYGTLAIKGQPMTVQQIARTVGESQGCITKLLDELERAGVFSRDEGGAIFSRRMVKDEHIRNIRASAGRLGGNPNLLNQNDKQTPKQTSKQSPTPSSSSSSSTSDKGKTIRADALLASLGVSEQTAKDWIAMRKTQRAAITETALNGIQREAGKAGMSLEAALRTCCERGWRGFKADWVRPQARSGGVQDARLNTARQIFGGDHGTHGRVIEVALEPAVEGDRADLPEALPGVR